MREMFQMAAAEDLDRVSGGQIQSISDRLPDLEPCQDELKALPRRGERHPERQPWNNDRVGRHRRPEDRRPGARNAGFGGFGARSRDQFVDHSCGELIGQAPLQSVATVYQIKEIHTEKAQHGGMEVMHADGVFHGMAAQFVGSAVNGTALHSATRHPQGEAVGAVILSRDCSGCSDPPGPAAADRIPRPR